MVRRHSWANGIDKPIERKGPHDGWPWDVTRSVAAGTHPQGVRQREAGETILISTSPGPAFNEALKAAKVPLSPGAE